MSSQDLNVPGKFTFRKTCLVVIGDEKEDFPLPNWIQRRVLGCDPPGKRAEL